MTDLSTAEDATFAELFTQETPALKEGEVVSGTVLSIDDDHVQIDIGFKSIKETKLANRMS